MWQFILGIFIGANISLVLYAIILVGKRSEQMNTEFVINYINNKVSENKNYIRYTFYELRVKNNLSETEVDEFLRINKDYFENKGYNVYFTGAKFTYESATRTVQNNELMIATKID